MRQRHGIRWLVATVLLIGASVVPGLTRGRAASQPAHTVAVAVSTGVSAATGHLFVLSTSITPPGSPYAGPQPSWVSMLDARTYKVLRVIPVLSGATQILVNDHTWRAFVVQAFGPRYPTSVTTLDTRTGVVLRHTECGQGLLTDVLVAPLAGRLFLVTSPSGSLGTAVIHVLDTTSGKQLRAVPVSPATSMVSAGAVDEQAGRLYLANASAITVYDLRSLRVVRTIPASTNAPLLLADDVHNRVLTVSSHLPHCTQKAELCGGELNVLTAVDVRSGTLVAAMRIGTTRLAALALVPGSDRLFALSAGTYTAQGRPASDGTLRMLAGTDYRPLRTISTGVVGGNRPAMVVDRTTRHLFVVSDGHLKGSRAGTSAALLSVVDVRTGVLVRATPLPALRRDATSGAALMLAAQGGRVYVTGFDPTTGQGNNVTVLSATSGTVVRSVALVGPPSGKP